MHKEKLRQGNQFGKIVVKSPYQEITYTIVASTSGKLDVDIRLTQEKSKLDLQKDCLSYLCYETAVASCLAGKENPGVNSWMDFSTWSASSHYILNQLHQSGCDYPEYQMYEAFLLYMENHYREKQELFWKAIRINPIQEMIWVLLEFICICARLPVYIRTRFTPCPESANFTCRKVTAFRFYGSC